MNGDMTTSVGVAEINVSALKARMNTFEKEIASACNKNILSKARGAEVSEFLSQPVNMERIQAEFFIDNGYNFRIIGRSTNVIISPNGEEYIIAMKKFLMTP